MIRMKINVLLVIVVVFTVYKVIDGYKKGMVKEIISLISLLVLSAVVALLANGIGGYQRGEIFRVIIAVILLALLGSVHHLLGVVFFSAKLVAKLPIISFLDKILGIVFGAAEVVLFLWTLYFLIWKLELGAVGQVILSYTQESEILSWLYSHNYLRSAIEDLLARYVGGAV